MHAIILAAGRGSRLLPLTTDLPKCLLPIGNTTVLGMQLDTLYANGVKTATVVTGFNTHMPFFQVADNLASCWMVREAMHQDFLLINGDTLFSPELLQTVLAAPTKNIAVTIDQKGHYDGDDMKVTLAGSQLTAIGKTLQLTETDGESIGMLRFMDAGPKIFRNELERLMKTPEGTTSWFLSAIHGLAQSGQHIDTINIKGAEWSELDTSEDYEICRSLFGDSETARKRFAIV